MWCRECPKSTAQVRGVGKRAGGHGGLLGARAGRPEARAELLAGARPGHHEQADDEPVSPALICRFPLPALVLARR